MQLVAPLAEEKGSRCASVFAVIDNRKGISPYRITRVFDRFWSGDDHERVGLGLGLAIVKGLVEAMGGRAWVESEEDRGSKFCFALPTADTRAVQHAH